MSGDDNTTGEGIDPKTEETRLDAVNQYLEYLRETTPYYSWLDPEIDSIDRGFVRLLVPNKERFQPPEVAPQRGLNGGIIMTLVDAVGMAAIIAEALEPIGLTTTHLNTTFHDGVDETHVIEGEVTDFGDTLATADVVVVPASEVDDPDRKILASATATAHLFDD